MSRQNKPGITVFLIEFRKVVEKSVVVMSKHMLSRRELYSRNSYNP